MIWISLIAVGLSFAAVEIAYAAFRVSHHQLEEQPAHNRLSVRPLIQFRRVQSPLPERDYVGLYLMNAAVGLAEVLFAQPTPQGVPCPEDAAETVSRAQREEGGFSAWAAVLRARVADLPTIYFAAEVYALVRPGEEICVLGIRADRFESAWEDEIDRFLCGLGLTVRYRSLYGEELQAVLHPVQVE